jgi:tryptophanyl-tRNA synthetase
MRILTGVQPSGKLHLGNYFAVMGKMIRYQSEHELFCFIANLHSLTSFKSKEALENHTFDAACDFYALGIDNESFYPLQQNNFLNVIFRKVERLLIFSFATNLVYPQYKALRLIAHNLHKAFEAQRHS